jgi:hypothetical protein
MEKLIGLYFHGKEDDSLTQGKVVSRIDDKVFLVEYYSFLDGQRHHLRLVTLEEMFGWRFFDNDEWMRTAYEERL